MSDITRSVAQTRRAQAREQALYARYSAGQQPMDISLREVLRRSPLTCLPETNLREALVAMQHAKVGSIVVVDRESAPLGIFTERDVLRSAAVGELDLASSIAARMTPSPKSLPASASAADAAVLMASSGIRHVLVVEERKLVGVVSERDLFALQRASVRGINDAIENAAGSHELKQAAEDVRRLAGNLIGQGMGAEHLTLLIATLNDRLVRRILDLEAGKHDLAQIAFCWIALGSEGRLEQTLATDQDNGIVFSGNLRPEETRERLLPLARAVNHMLDECGFPLCRGNVMARNPQWCLSLAEWQEKFGTWIRNPLPSALLNSSIFFDFRGLWGETSLAHRLRAWLNAQVKDNLRFHRAMAQSALESRPPAGFFADLLNSIRKGAAIDLKAQGTRPFVDAARIYALASGLEHTNTAARLRLSGERLSIPHEEIEAMVAAFYVVLLFRLRRHHAGPTIGADVNRVSFGALNEIDRRILKEALRQSRKLHHRLALDFQL